MNLLETLFQAILEEPWDDAHRLVYADCLEEAGQPERAQFIRIQVEAARLPAGPARRALERRAELLARGRKLVWKKELPKLRGVTWEQFERGFIGTATFRSAFMFHRHINRVVHTIPLETVTLRVAESLNAIGNSKHVKRLGTLNLGFLHLSATAIRGLTQSPYLLRLRTLNLGYNELGDDGARILASSTAFPNLSELELRENLIGSAGALALAESPHLERLTRLGLENNHLDGEARKALTRRFGDRVVF